MLFNSDYTSLSKKNAPFGAFFMLYIFVCLIPDNWKQFKYKTLISNFSTIDRPSPTGEG